MFAVGLICTVETRAVGGKKKQTSIILYISLRDGINTILKQRIAVLMHLRTGFIAEISDSSTTALLSIFPCSVFFPIFSDDCGLLNAFLL